jgi:uncharacterized protein YdeI (BOF family)
MKRNNHPGEALALILAAALCAFTPGLAAQRSDNPQQGQQQQPQQENKTFAGTIQKLPNGQYALITGQTPDGKLAGHFLDDQENAKKYEGKQVKVTGTFDTASNTIHVTNIQTS